VPVSLSRQRLLLLLPCRNLAQAGRSAQLPLGLGWPEVRSTRLLSLGGAIGRLRERIQVRVIARARALAAAAAATPATAPAHGLAAPQLLQPVRLASAPLPAARRARRTGATGGPRWPASACKVARPPARARRGRAARGEAIRRVTVVSAGAGNCRG